MKSIQRTYQRTLCFCALTLAFSVPLLAAAATPAPSKRPVVVRQSKDVPDTQAAEWQEIEQTGQGIFQSLIAEVALQRGDLDFASKAYADLARRTRDPKVLERTVEVAGYARQFDLAIEAARTWLEVDPESKRAQQLLTGVLLLSNRLDELAPHLIRMLETDKSTLGENLLGLNRMLAQNTDRQAVFHLIDKVCTPYFGIAEAHYAVAMAAGSASAYERALAESRHALDLRPDWEMAAIMQAQLMSRDTPAEAVTFMKGFVERNPKAQEAELVLARMLVGEKHYAESKLHFANLLKAHPDNPDVVYPVAILALQQNDIALAEVQLKHLLELDIPDKSLPYYYLGQIAEEAKRNDQALSYYASVGEGEQYLSAQMRSAQILSGQGKLDEARTLLNDAKAATPEDRAQLVITEAALLREAKQVQAAFDLLDKQLLTQQEQPDLLYESALLAEKLGNMEVLESRLRKLIKLKPDNAQAYNALGYSFAERNIRLPEARELIDKALKLTPEDPFILDSLGWVLFRQGDLPGALTQLERAYGQRTDPEIAAHIGEVLWTMGRNDDALKLLHESQKRFPSNESLANTLKKITP